MEQLRNPDGNLVSIEKIEFEDLDAPITVYNFQVEDFHTYYVGETAVWVHNADCPSNKPYRSNKTANEQAKKQGFKDAHDLKEYYVGKENVSKFDMKYDTKTGEIFLESKNGNIKIPTGLINIF